MRENKLPRSASRRALLSLLLVVVSISISLVAIEFGLRYYAKATMQERGQNYDPELGWKPLPNIRKIGVWWGVKEPGFTNSKGFRDKEHDYAKPAGISRIVAVGDSFTFGVGVDYGERFTEHLAGTGDPIEVVNLGVNAYGTDQQLRMLQVEGLRYSPDLAIVVVYMGNDLGDIRYERRFFWPKPYYELENASLKLVKPPLTWDVWLRSTTYLGEILTRALQGRVIEADRLAPFWVTRDPVPLFEALTARMMTVGEENRFPVLFVLAYPQRELKVSEIATGFAWAFNSPQQLDLESRAREALARNRAIVLDTDATFTQHKLAGENLYAPDGHWNARGHAVVAEAIRLKIDEQGWLSTRSSRSE